MLSKNLVILSTSASLGVLIGLLGTVSGMIKSFSAMAAGVPDPAQLSVGISEALVNHSLESWLRLLRFCCTTSSATVSTSLPTVLMRQDSL